MKINGFNLLLMAALGAAQPDIRCLAASEQGFTKLFSGMGLDGWDGNPKLWSARDGVITGQTTADNPIQGNTFLIWTNGTVADFELRCSFKIVANNDAGFANSGIQYRSKILDPANWVLGGYQADMEAGKTYTGILYEERMTRGIMATRGEKVVWGENCEKQVAGSLEKSEDLQAAIRPADWNDYVIIAQGNHLQHFINGHQTVDVIDNCAEKRATSGVLGLQLHAGKAMTVQFRDLRLKTLSGPPAATAGKGDDLKKIQGVWQVTAVETDGNAAPADEISKITVTIKDSSYTRDNDGQTDRGGISLDASHDPREMDIKPESGDGAGATIPAIYEVNGNTMRVCYAVDGQRPSAFKAGEGSSRVLVTYKRKNP